MNAHCVPFRQIPHTTRLFLDYLSYTPSVRGFYPRSPSFSEWLNEEGALVRYDQSRRQQVAATLERQNRSWDASAKALANLERFRRGALTVVTGQQVGLFGGPLFSIYKALTAVKLAEQATAASVDCVPVFWLATEDHDLAEVNHVSLLSPQGVAERVTVESRGIPDAPVGAIKFGPEIGPVMERAASLLGDSEVTTWLRESYREGETLGSGFARLFARLFADWGVILLDPADPELHDLAKPLFRAAIEKAPELDEALLARGKSVEAAGYHQQVKVTAASTLLFEVKNGARTVVHRKANGSTNPEFQVGHEKVSQHQLLDRIEAGPENFNANVLFRPVVQDYLLPTLAYTGGAAEVAYFAQVAVVYEKLLGRVTPVLPRFSATLVEPKAERILTRYHLQLQDLFHGSDKVRETIAARSLPPDLQGRFAAAYSGVEQSMTALRDSLDKLDATLIRSSDRARMRMWHQVNRLHRQASRAEILRNEVISHHTAALCNALFPHKTLQERELAGISMVARYGSGLLGNLYNAIDTGCHDHQVISLQ
ncbi:MAG: bacillithiol biosynthesis cysteine-adding enzyme BshC [Terriglobales bacterium]